VAALPAGAVAVGEADDGVALLVDPADPAAAYVAGPAGVERWPAVPAHPDASGALVEGSARPNVFVVGDSVVLGAEPQLRAAFGSWAFTLDAAVSRFTREGIDVLRARRAEVADVVVVALGYNDGIDVEPFRATAGALLDELAGVALVVWVNLRATQPYYAADDAVLLELAATRPNVVVADWAAASAPLPPEAFAADGLHLTPTSAAVLADLVAGTVLGWHRGHPEQGDQSCRPALDAVVGAGG
jgi:lysophospholipase L1-like esterase